MKQLLAITGPTGSGKTSWSIKLAKKINGAIICADSRTVYQGLDIGTNKVTAEYDYTKKDTPLGPVFCIQGIDHYGLDLVKPDEYFTLSDFVEHVSKVIANIYKAGKIPILVGGTGLYIEAITEGYKLPRAADLPIKFKKLSTFKLFLELINKDSKSKLIDPKNRHRIERALAYYLSTGESITTAKSKTKPNFKSHIFVIDRDRKELYQRIDQQIDNWIAQGLFAEVTKLLEQGISPERISKFGLVYRATLNHISLTQASAQILDFKHHLAGKLHAYARRQLTWWRRNPDVHWISSYTELECQVMSLIK
jgi:tRNA dimethylallyltransferase